VRFLLCWVKLCELRLTFCIPFLISAYVLV
jgi:hypothetical protein